MANIRKRKSKSTGQYTYQAQIYTGRDSCGKPIFEYITTEEKRDCVNAAKERELELANGNFANVGKVQVVAGIEQWIELKRPELSPGTILLYKKYLKAHYKPFFCDMKYKQVSGNEMLLRKFKSELLKKMSPNTAHKVLSVLNKIFRETLRDKNPLKYVELPKKVKPARRVPADEEFAQIHAKIAGTIDEIFALLAAWGGLRLGEICALRPDDLFEEKGIIRVDENLTINDNYDWEDKAPKSDNGTREVAIPNDLFALINRFKVKKGKITDRLFNYLPGSYTHRWARIIEEKELPKVTFHSLRHFHATWLYEQGYDDQYAAKRLGHDVNTLKTIYQHLWGKKIISQDESVRQKLSGKNDIQKQTEDGQ